MKKINAHGHYLPFPGITVVASIQESDVAFWHHIFDLLRQSELLKSYFSPLPVSSYHVTTLNLCVASDFQAHEWSVYIKTALRHVYQPMYEYLQAHAFTPEIHFEYIQTKGVIQLVFKISEKQHDIIVQTAQRFGLEAQMPPAYHMTLAYQYRDISQEELLQLEEYLHAEISKVMQSVQYGCRLNPPTLCYFNDMSAFYPWDAQRFPF